jgi:hypothetical protein
MRVGWGSLRLDVGVLFGQGWSERGEVCRHFMLVCMGVALLSSLPHIFVFVAFVRGIFSFLEELHLGEDKVRNYFMVSKGRGS